MKLQFLLQASKCSHTLESHTIISLTLCQSPSFHGKVLVYLNSVDVGSFEKTFSLTCHRYVTRRMIHHEGLLVVNSSFIKRVYL